MLISLDCFGSLEKDFSRDQSKIYRPLTKFSVCSFLIGKQSACSVGEKVAHLFVWSDGWVSHYENETWLGVVSCPFLCNWCDVQHFFLWKGWRAQLFGFWVATCHRKQYSSICPSVSPNGWSVWYLKLIKGKNFGGQNIPSIPSKCWPKGLRNLEMAQNWES